MTDFYLTSPRNSTSPKPIRNFKVRLVLVLKEEDWEVALASVSFQALDSLSYRILKEYPSGLVMAVNSGMTDRFSRFE